RLCSLSEATASMARLLSGSDLLKLWTTIGLKKRYYGGSSFTPPARRLNNSYLVSIENTVLVVTDVFTNSWKSDGAFNEYLDGIRTSKLLLRCLTENPSRGSREN